MAQTQTPQEGRKAVAKQGIATNVVGRTAWCRPGLEHCWKFKKDETGEIVACWYNTEEQRPMVAVRGADGSIEQMSLGLINIRHR